MGENKAVLLPKSKDKKEARVLQKNNKDSCQADGICLGELGLQCLTAPKNRIENSANSQKVKTNRISSLSLEESVKNEPNINHFPFNQPGNTKEQWLSES